MPKKSKYVLSKRAKADLEGIWLYGLETWSIYQAEQYATGLYEKFDFLVQWPNAGKPAKNIREGYFRYELQSHTIFYRIEKTSVRIVRVLHEKMDMGRHL
jgi:toxin ParE1/3/4